MAFLTILAPPELIASERRQAARAGPPALLARRDHRTMLSTVGFRDIEETDLTADYLHSVRAWLDESSARESELRRVLGDALFADRQKDRQAQIVAIERGLLRRSLFVARG